MRTFVSKVFSVARHYLTFWHLQRALVYLYIDVFRLAFVRRGAGNNVLILKFDHLGDYIIARNFLVRIRDHPRFQGKRVILCANAVLKDFIEVYDAAAFDEVFWIDRRRMLDEMDYRWEVLKQIKQRGAEVAIQCTYGLESFAGDCVMRASGAKERLGRWISRAPVADATGEKEVPLGPTFYTPLVEQDQVIFDFDRHLALFSAILPEADLPTDTRLVAKPVDIPYIESPYIILMPGASDAFREWPPEHFAQVALHFHETRKFRAVILGTKADAPKADTIRKAAPGVPVESLCGGLTLPQVVYLMSRAAGGITNDSGGIHLLAALGKPGVAVSNGISIGFFHPYPRKLHPTVSFVYPQALYDQPLSMAKRKLLYNAGHHLNVADVTPAAIIARLDHLLDAKPYLDPIEAAA